MNSGYETLLRRLLLPSTVVDCAMGRLRPPLPSLTYPPPWYGYLPALIPIWNESGIGVGIWKHWFTERPFSFVEAYADFGLVEIARTPDQFLCYATISAIVAHDEVVPEIEHFARAAGVGNLAELDAATSNTGDDPLGFTAIRQFQTDTPLASVADVSRYDGWFPRLDFTAPIPWWQHCCSLEVDDDLVAQLF